MSDFGSDLDERLRAAGRSQSWLAAELGVTPSSVSNWVAGKHEPNPTQVFAVERALGAAPGSLARHLGFQPVGSSGVLAAIDADPSLDLKARKALKAAYRSLREES